MQSHISSNPGPSGYHYTLSGNSYSDNRGRTLAVDPTLDGFDNLRRAMEPSPPPSQSSPPPQPSSGGSTSTESSTFFKAFSFLKGLTPLKSTLQRPFSECRSAVLRRLDELHIRWKEPHGTGYIYCESGQKGTSDYVAFHVEWLVNGATSPPLPGADMWYTKIIVSKTSGSGQKFREVGKEVLNAAKYVVRGGVRFDYSVTTWGLY